MTEKVPICDCCHKGYDEPSEDSQCKLTHEYYQWVVEHPGKGMEGVAEWVLMKLRAGKRND